MPPKPRPVAVVPGQGSAAPADEPRGLAHQVHKTLSELDLRPEHAAIAALAVEFAKTMDRAAAIAAQAARIVPESEAAAEELERLRKRVAAHVVVVELGPKLQSALDALLATPKARAAAGKTPSKPAGKLSALRAAGAS